MASIEEEEITDVDGSVIKRRILRADSIRITLPDGTEEELKDLPDDFRAEEDPWTRQGEPAKWVLFKFPFGSFEASLSFIPGQESLPSLVTFLNENGETLLKLGAIFVQGLRSAEPEILLEGEEMPRD